MKRIVVQNVQKTIKDTTILNSANLCVDDGEICALIGPNGVGKTTLTKCLLGLAHPDSGNIRINDKILSGDNCSELLFEIGAVLQYPNSISHLTIDQLFAEHFQYLNLNPLKLWDELLGKVELAVPINTQIGKLSLGMKQRLLLAVTLSHNPNIIVLDEPFNGLDVDGIILIKGILKVLKNNGVSILIASHSLSELEDVATSVVFMLNGATFAKKSTKEILQDYEGGLKQYYQVLKKGGAQK